MVLSSVISFTCADSCLAFNQGLSVAQHSGVHELMHDNSSCTDVEAEERD